MRVRRMRVKRIRQERSGQGEILGLAVVVVLVVVGFMLAIRLGGTGDGASTKDVVTDRKMASAMINVMLHSNLDCKDITLSEVIQDCANDASTFEYCGSPRRLACYEAENVTAAMLDRTLRKWGRGYLFKVYTKSDEKFEHSYLDCGTTLSNAEKERFPMPTKSGPIYIELTICAREVR